MGDRGNGYGAITYTYRHHGVNCKCMSKASKVPTHTGAVRFVFNLCLLFLFPQPQKVVQEVPEEQQVRKMKSLINRRVVQFCFDAAL